MNKIKNIILTLSLVFGVGFFALMPLNVGAQVINPCDVDPNGILCENKDEDLMDYVKKIVNTMLYVLGALSVVMIIFGGIKYTTSAGDAKGVESAKNTIMYAVIGLVVALLAFAIVNFVISSITKS